MSTDTSKTPPIACVTAEPGICGFPCTIKAQKSGNRTVTVEINGSECKQIQRLSTCLTEMSLKELFMPLTRNPVYIAAEKSGCHPSCAIPAAVIKAVEVALGMALPKEVRIKFKSETNEKTIAKQINAMQTPNVVPFKTNEGISHDLLKRLLEKGIEYGLTAVFPFSVDRIMVAEWVHLKCRYGCNKYNTNWCCPPATPNPETVRKIIDEYTTALLLVGTKNCSDFYRNNGRKRDVQVRCWKGTIGLERMLFLEGYYKAFSLVGECCALCKECAYPGDCRFPQEKRPSVESFSIDVIGTLKNLGTTSKVATNTGATFNYYGIVLLE